MNDFDCYELLLVFLGLDDDATDDEIEEKLYDDYDVDISEFKKIAGRLMKFSHIAPNPLSDNLNIGFADHSNGRFITMQEYKADPK